MVYAFLSTTELEVRANQAAEQLQAAVSGKISRILGFQVTLLELFDHEYKKLTKIGYCDFEIAYFSYKVAVALLHKNSHSLVARTQDFIETIKELIEKKILDFSKIEEHLDAAGRAPVAGTVPPASAAAKKAAPEDLLLERFQKLTTSSTTAPSEPTLSALSSSSSAAAAAAKQQPAVAPATAAPSASPYEAFKYNECITAPELHKLLSDPHMAGKVLLVDYRTRKEFDYNHVNYADLVQIDPSWVSGLEMGSGDKQLTDQDLEQRLQMLMPAAQYSKFQRRSQYELVVIYNLKYGPHEWRESGRKFQELQNSLVSGDKSGIPSSSPFLKLIDLITFRNKYLSSKLKRHPVYLGGGVVHWFDKYGEKSIAKSSMAGVGGGGGGSASSGGSSANGGGISEVPLSRPEASITRTGSRSSSYSAPSNNSSVSRRNSYNGTGQMNGDSLNLSRSSSPYLRNFSDYISTATSSGAPVSTYRAIEESSSSPSYYSELSGNGGSSHRGGSGHQLSNYGTTSSASTTASGGSFHNGHTNGNGTLTTNGHSAPSASSKAASSTTPTSLYKQPSAAAPPASSSVSSASASAAATASTVKFLEQYTTGLTNLGNSCYMNCVLQCLGATPQLTSFFFPSLLNAPASKAASPDSSIQTSYRQHINVNNRLGSKGILTTTFVTLLTNMFSSNGKFFTPTSFKKVMGSLSPGGQFASFDQQDCIEFLNFVLDGLHEDLNQMEIKDPREKQSIMELTPEQEKTRELLPVRLASTIEWERYLKLNFSIIVDYFQGQYLSKLKCLECGLTSTTYNAFSILSLPIPEKLGGGGGRVGDISLDDCLKEFVTTELLDNNNKWHCPRCKKFTKSTKKISITRLPQVLIIHFKRFKISLKTGYMDKMNTMIKYPVNSVLDLTSYWPPVGTLNQDHEDAGTPPMSREKEQQILSTLPTRNQTPPFRYKLYGVVNHFGTLSTGHYTSYVYKESDSKKKRGWCYFDDAKVTYNCKESQVMNSNAYCLFYQRE